MQLKDDLLFYPPAITPSRFLQQSNSTKMIMLHYLRLVINRQRDVKLTEENFFLNSRE